MPKRLILCDCSGSNQIDGDALSQAVGLPCSKVHNGLCTSPSDAASKALSDGDAVFCCTQECAFFDALAGDLGVPLPGYLDLRDRAGWSDDPQSKLPKMAALTAEAMLPAAAMKQVDVISEGMCLILGGDKALAAAEQLQGHLAVTLLLDNNVDLPASRGFDVIRGQLRLAKGALGQFALQFDRLQSVLPGGRGGFEMSEPRDGAKSACDVILDLTGGTPLFPAYEKREGYLRPDPGDPGAVAAAVLEASHLVGIFEKPLYVKTEPLLCAHSRAEQTGCTRCLDVCPTGAISSAGDYVNVDPMVCAGCGACASLCPSGAITYDAPPQEQLFRRVQTLASAYRKAGGDAPRLLVVNGFGNEMVQLCARFGAGLPADVIPLEVDALGAFGHAEALAALAAGFADVTILLAPTTDRDVMNREVALANAISGAGNQINAVEVTDPEALTAVFDTGEMPQIVETPLRPMGTRRQITRTAAKALHPAGGALHLPEGAPYGAVLVDTNACSLCLSCVSLCPSGALADNPDMPQLRFQEDACLQCGLCSNVCPEDAITYAPQLNLDDSALEQLVLHQEEPFACVECGALFGVKSTIEKITEKLAGKHAMFKSGDAARMIKMCDTCRVNAQYHAENNPFEGGQRPRPRTTEDYLSKRRDH